MAVISVCLSVCPDPDPNSRTEGRGKLKIGRKEDRNICDLCRAGLKLWGALGRYPIPAGAIYTRGGKKLAIFDGNRRLSLKRCEIGQVTMQNIFHSFRETDYRPTHFFNFA